MFFPGDADQAWRRRKIRRRRTGSSATNSANQTPSTSATNTPRSKPSKGGASGLSTPERTPGSSRDSSVSNNNESCALLPTECGSPHHKKVNFCQPHASERSVI